jgi:ADP-dependent NAD(P)H-hydrate dehydratase / NAD(P)H-hydrate epimerase
MKVLTSAEMRRIDHKTIEEIGIPGAVLMENAGIRIFKALLSAFPFPETEKIVIVAGKGNNGGDGLVVARHLWNRGARPVVLLAAAKDEIRGDAALNLKIALNAGIKIKEVASAGAWKREKRALAGATVIVDALFGTGLVRPLEGFYAAVVKDINASDAFKLAVDIPSGLSSDSAVLIGPCVHADMTVTLAAPKIAHVFSPAVECVGDLVIAPIGIPPLLFDDPELKLEMTDPGDVLPFFPGRLKEAHKGSYGHVLVIAGSLGKTGAAILAGRAALKMGAGLVTVATPSGCLPLVARGMAELMTEPLAETPEKTIAAEAVPRALELLKGKTALVLGPGISTRPRTAAFVKNLLPQVRIPMVIDADGLNIVATDPTILNSLKAKAVLTPHPGEFGRLAGLTTREVLADRVGLARAFARRHGVYLVLKGHRTLTAGPDGMVTVNPTGNPGMATGGSGDVLSGMIAAQIAQEKQVRGSVVSAVFAHGLAGDVAAGHLGERALIAGDIIRFLPEALKAIAG